MLKSVLFASCGLILLIQIQWNGICKGQDLIGGLWNDEKPASMEVRHIISTIKPQITEKIKAKREGFYFHGGIKPVSYKIQVVNGLNYFIKIRAKIGNKFTYYHVRVHKDFSGAFTFVNLEGPMRTHDDIKFF